MEEILQKLLEAEVLSEDTKTELETAFKTKLEEAIKAATEETTSDVKAELAEQWIEERDALIEAIDSKVSEFLNDEMAELKEDINRFRDLEVEYASKLTEAKAQMSDELKGDLGELVEKLDTFLEIRLNTEMTELREDIQVQKQNVFGRKIFEAVAREFEENYAKDDDLSQSLAETKSRLRDTTKALKESEKKMSLIEREQKMLNVLSPLKGKSREVMEAILKNVSTEQLEEGYKTFIGRVLKESDIETNDDKEIIKENKKDIIKKRILPENSKLVSGDNIEKLSSEEKSQLSESTKEYLQKFAGIKK